MNSGIFRSTLLFLLERRIIGSMTTIIIKNEEIRYTAMKRKPVNTFGKSITNVNGKTIPNAIIVMRIMIKTWSVLSLVP